VSVYLGSRFADEHERDRVRVFLKSEIKKAHHSPSGHAIKEDLDWIEAQGETLIEGARFPEARGVALFVSKTLGLREVIPVGRPLEDAFVVAEAPYLTPLVALLGAMPSLLVVFVDGESARLIPLNTEGAGEEVSLESEVPGHHRRGGWAQLAQSRYQRHVEDHRGRHFEATAEVVIALTEGNGVERIVMAGEPRTIAAFKKHLPRRATDRIAGSVSGTKHEAASVILGRAAELLARLRADEGGRAVDAVLTEAAKGRHAVAGIEETLDAVNRGAVHRLYLLENLSAHGQVCAECKSFQRGGGEACRLCGNPTKEMDLGEAIVSRVIAAGGTAETVKLHEGLARVGGLAALLRYSL
jgi:peptide subunit release factor 1 (eRF1)